MFDRITDIAFSSKLMVALRTLCGAAKNGDACLDLELLRAVGASVFRQLFAQLSSEVSHFTHPYYSLRPLLALYFTRPAYFEPLWVSKWELLSARRTLPARATYSLSRAPGFATSRSGVRTYMLQTKKKGG